MVSVWELVQVLVSCIGCDVHNITFDTELAGPETMYMFKGTELNGKHPQK